MNLKQLPCKTCGMALRDGLNGVGYRIVAPCHQPPFDKFPAPAIFNKLPYSGGPP